MLSTRSGASGGTAMRRWLTGFDQLAVKRSSSLIRRWVTPWLGVAAERLDTELEGRFRSYALRGSARCRVRHRGRKMPCPAGIRAICRLLSKRRHRRRLEDHEH